MKYGLATIIAVILAYLVFLIFTTTANKNAGIGKNAKYSAIVMSLSMPFILIIGIVIFLLGKLVVMTLPIGIDNFQLFVISILGIFIVFIGDFLTKTIALSFSSYLLDKRYDHSKLDDASLKSIVKKTRKNSELLSISLLYLGSFFIYLGALKLLSITATMMFLILFSLINILVYSLFFKFKSKDSIVKG